jgi:hypothetical protein
MRNGYREKAIACAILHHLESYLFLWEQRRRTPLILMLYASVKVIMLVWKIMENTGFILDIFSIDKNTKTAVLKWEETRKKDTVHLGDCKKYNKLDVIPRKQKSTDFFCEIPQTKRGKPPPGQMKNMFFSDENSSKLCAKGAIQNLLNMLHFLPEEMNIFGELATSDLFTLMKSFNESFGPKAVLTPSLGINLIQKCLWILRKKIKFQTKNKLTTSIFSV